MDPANLFLISRLPIPLVDDNILIYIHESEMELTNNDTLLVQSWAYNVEAVQPCARLPTLRQGFWLQSRHEQGEFFSINFGGSTLRLAYVVLGKAHKQVVRS